MNIVKGIIMLVLPVAVFSQSSTNYVMRSSVMNSSGRKIASANFKVLNCVGQSTPIGIDSSSNCNLYAGFIYTTLISPLPGISDEYKIDIPKIFALYQNFPNPFARSTIIRYALPVESSVRLNIYDVVGRKIITLVDKKEKPGYKSVVWETNHKIAGGIYFYRLEIGDFLKTRKMLVVK